jgi:ketosteroid isomerase-like protein
VHGRRVAAKLPAVADDRTAERAAERAGDRAGDDRDEITALLSEYAACIDGGDLDGVAALFAAATFRSPAGTALRGPAEVRRMFDFMLLYDGVPRTRHVITNPIVDIADDGASATSTCQFVVLQALEGAPLEPILAGRYVDVFGRSAAGAWEFRDRFVVTDLTGDLSRHYVVGSTDSQSPS